MQTPIAHQCTVACRAVRGRFLAAVGLIACLPGMPVMAGNVHVTSAIAGLGQQLSLDHPTEARLAQRQRQTVDDWVPDVADALGNLVTGELKVRALSGGGGSTAAGASARFTEEITITSVAGAAPALATLRLDAHALTDSLTGTTGGRVGGVATTDFSAALDLRAIQVLPNGFRTGASIFNRAGYAVQAGHTFVAENESTVREVIPRPPVVLDNDILGVGAPGFANPAQDVRYSFNALSVSGVDSVLEIDFLVSAGDIFEVGSEIRAIAAGPVGHLASVDGFNTAALSLILPDGYDFSSTSGVFLSQLPGPTPVPLPAPILPLTVTLMMLPWSRRSYRS
ncbi:MAG: hypothetical protein KDK91_25045 [Gammaproteobacteria bacterium]|nr:hypothetical protein [Gammaproteobacteria bacterium]